MHNWSAVTDGLIQKGQARKEQGGVAQNYF